MVYLLDELWEDEELKLLILLNLVFSVYNLISIFIFIGGLLLEYACAFSERVLWKAGSNAGHHVCTPEDIFIPSGGMVNTSLHTVQR